MYIIFAGLMLCILTLAIAHPANNLISWQMLLGTMAGTVLLLAAGALWNRIYEKIGRRTGLYVLCLVGFGVALYLTSLCREGNAYTLADYTQIYSAAMDLANGSEISNASYFLNYSNNLKPMFLLSLLFRAAGILHLPVFPFTLAVNVVQVLLVIWGCGYLAEWEGDTRWRFPILVAFVLFLPVWGMVSVFYTDSMSFGLGILGLAFLKKAGNKAGKRRIVWFVCAALSMVLAAAWKITAMIPVIAAVIIILWQRLRCSWKSAVTFLTVFAAFSLALSIWTNTYEVTRQARTTADPLLSWVALGMREDGSWNNNREFVDRLNELPTTDAKMDYTLEYMKANRDSFFDREHLVRKICRNFANGNLGVSEFLFIEDDDGTLIWDLFSPWGSRYWRTSQYCFCYLGSMYVLLLLGMLRCIYDLCRGRELSPLLMICQLAFFGIFLFLMLWEANSRQLYNQMPGIILGSVLSMRAVGTFFIEKKARK